MVEKEKRRGEGKEKKWVVGLVGVGGGGGGVWEGERRYVEIFG